MIPQIENWNFRGHRCNAGVDQFVTPNSMVTLDGSNSYDPDGNIIALEWIQTGGIAVSLVNEQSLTTTFMAPNSNGDLTFCLFGICSE